MNEKLKECPFCGGQVKIDNIGDKKENIYMIECDVCGAALSFASHTADGWYCHAAEDETIKAWNRRVEK